MDSIIVVEDELLILDMYIEVLEMAGYKVRAFPNADLAWNYISERGFNPRLLITDLRMPGRMDGAQLVERVRRLSSEVPIVIASGYHDAANMLCNRKTHWLSKPFGIDQLQEICKTLAPIGQ